MNRIKLPKLKDAAKYKNSKSIINSLHDKSQQDIVKKAIQVGFLVYPSKELLLAMYKQQFNYHNYLNDSSDNDDNEERAEYQNDEGSRFSVVKSKSDRLDLNYEHYVLENELEKILFLNLRSVPIIELGHLAACTSLRILILSNNYLIDIEGLRECVNLFRLDLQNNQVKLIINILL